MTAELLRYGLRDTVMYTSSPRTHVVVGELSQSSPGLSRSDFDALASTIDAIVHSGALVDWMHPLRDYMAR